MGHRADLAELLLDLAWSHWTTLGVAGAAVLSETAIDLEALMILTAELAPDDPRLRDEALDWCIKFHRYSSKPRLKQLLKRSSPSAQASFAPFAGALEEHAGGTWPATKPGARDAFEPSGKSRAPNLDRPALLHLKLRALFGVGARADIIGALLIGPSETFGAADLVFVGYTKRNLADALDLLAAGGLFRAARAGNRIRFSWHRHRELSLLLKPLPKRIPQWPIIMRLLSGFLSLLTRLEGKSDRLYLVEAARSFHQLAPDLQALGLEAPPTLIGTATAQTVVKWLLATTTRMIRPDDTAVVPGRAASRV